MKKLPRTLGSAIFVVACTLVGCAPYSTLCEDEMQCRDGNEADIDACIVGYERNADLADLYDCPDLWDRYVDCVYEKAHCENSDVWTTDGNCTDERDDYNNCVN